MSTLNLTRVANLLAAQFGDCEPFENADSQLHIAAFEGNVELLAEALSRNPPREEINKKNNFGCSPLRLAAAGGHADCVKMLLENEAALDTCDVKGQTPLYAAVKNSQIRCVELLLEHGANPDGDPSNRTTPLYVAAMNGQAETVKLLLNYKATILIKRTSLTNLSFTVDPLCMALTYHHFDCLKILLCAGGRPLHMQAVVSPFTGVTSLYHMAVRHKCGAKFAELLYEFGLTPWVKDANGLYPWDPKVRVDSGLETDDILAFFNRVLEEPRSLKSWCRLSVWGRILTLGKTTAALEHLQNVPENIRLYLTFQQL